MNNLVENKTFEQKMMDRVKESIGDLMTDDDLKRIVARGVEEAFFKPRKIGGLYNEKTIAPLAIEMVKEIYSAEIKQQVIAWAKSHPDEIKSVLESFIAGGFSGLVMKALNDMFQTTMEQLRFDITSKLS